MRDSVSFGVAGVAIILIAVSSFVGFFAGYASGVRRQESAARGEAAQAADVCEKMVRMGLKDWQAKVGVPLTQQVQCEPLRKIAEGRG